MAKKGFDEEEGKAPPSPFPLHGDLLGEVLQHLPTVDLIPAMYVSTAWRQAVHTCLLRTRRSKPWLLLHTQPRRGPPGTVATHAYDPNSRVWLRVPFEAPQPHFKPFLGSSPGSGLLYELTPSRLAVCAGAPGSPWRDLGPLIAWRTDPVVAIVGPYIVVAGGNCGFIDDDTCTVEVNQMNGAGGEGNAAASDPIPEAFGASASATLLSAAASDRRMYLMEKSTGSICSFDVETRTWGPMAVLRPDPSLFFSVIAFSNSSGRLILAGLGRDEENAANLKLWAVDCDSLECEAIGGMPREMLGRLAEGEGSSPFELCAAGDFAYVYRRDDPTAIFSCDFGAGECRWMELEAPAEVREKYPMQRCVLACFPMGIDDLRRIFSPAANGQ